MRIFNGPDELKAAAGTNVGASDWLTVDQARIDTFADATDDHQWIHVDAEKAKSGPFGTTIAHGFLSLSLLVPLAAQVYRVDGVKMGINYGLNKVRFPAPVKVDSNIRLAATIVDVQPTKDGAKEITFDGAMEVEGLGRPACVAQVVFRFYG